MPSRPNAAPALALAILAVLAGLLSVVPKASAGAAVVFSEDFEDGVLNPRFSVYDSNAASGLDYWGISGYRAYGGAYSAWAAQVGNQSAGPFVGQNNSDPGVQTYDDNMDADLVVDLRVNGFASLTLSFFYFIRTENGGGDWIQAWYEAGGIQTNIFDPRGSTGASWASVSLNVPNDIERMIIRFHTDAANNGFEGAYVDDIVLTGTEDVPPVSSVSALATYSNADPFLVPFDAQDNENASGVAYVELWYRYEGSSSWVKYTQPANPLGEWVVSPIRFDTTYANGDGFYEFYTVAVDNAGNAEAPPASSDASVTIDTVAPQVQITGPSEGSEVSGSVRIEWTASDDRSGIDRYEIGVDGGAFIAAGTGTAWDVSGISPGTHTVVVRAFDRAGNVGETTVTFTVGGGFPWWIVALLAALLIGGLLFFLVWKRRKEREARAEPARRPEIPPSSREAPQAPSTSVEAVPKEPDGSRVEELPPERQS